ncbi:YceI family protein [Apibacter sp. HY039]|uniref:YceI family protein n=1 Tax=Apibacter sp. HY039 TaxID=2501476 RepID=UPI000FEBB769|nr:YceI family protein [Apibacter sp. HY039]
MRKIVVTLGIAVFTIIGMQSCKEGSKETKTTTEAKEEVQASEDAANYQINTVNSNIKWLGQSIATKHHGIINFKSGELTVKDGKLEAGSFIADMNTIKSEDEADESIAKKLDEHLKAEEIFDVAKYPDSKFTITSVKPLEGDYNTELEGNLEIKGTSKNVKVKANVTIEGNNIIVKTEKFTINRQDFNITYSNGNPQDKLIKDLFDMEVELHGTK